MKETKAGTITRIHTEFPAEEPAMAPDIYFTLRVQEGGEAVIAVTPLVGNVFLDMCNFREKAARIGDTLKLADPGKGLRQIQIWREEVLINKVTIVCEHFVRNTLLP